MYAVARDVTERRRAEAEAKRLADEQAALRRVATLVAREASQAEVFAAIARRDRAAVRHGGGSDGALRGRAQRVVRGEPGVHGALPVGSRQALGGRQHHLARVPDTGEPARIDDDAHARAARSRSRALGGIRCVVAVPVRWKAGCGAPSRRGRPRRAAAAGHRVPHWPVHRADGDRDRQHRVARQGGAARRRAGRAAAGGDAGRRGRLARRGADAVAAEMEALLDADQVALNRFEPGERDPRARSPRARCGANAGRLAREHRGRERDGKGAAHRAAGPDGRLRARGGCPRRARARHRAALECRGADRGGGPALGVGHGELEGRGVAAARHRGADGAVRPAAGHRDRERRQP